MTFTITGKAAERLRRIRWRKKAEGHVRIITEKRGGSQWVFKMGFDTQREGDELIMSQGVAVVMDRQTARELDGMTVDYAQTGGKGVFTFSRNPPSDQESPT